MCESLGTATMEINGVSDTRTFTLTVSKSDPVTVSSVSYNTHTLIAVIHVLFSFDNAPTREPTGATGYLRCEFAS